MAGLRRSLHFVPGGAERMFDKALGLPADALILDLEDAVAADAKDDARHQVRRWLDQADFGPRERIVRANPLDSPWGRADVEALFDGAPPDALLVPKVRGPEEIIELAALLTSLEAAADSATPAVELIIVATETPQAVLALEAIARAPRVTALTWGAEDLSAALGARRNRDDTGAYLPVFAHCRIMTLLAASAAGVAPVDGVYVDFRDPDGLRAECREAADSGFQGKMTIHPSQIETVNDCFSPDARAVDAARALLDAWAEHERAAAAPSPTRARWSMRRTSRAPKDCSRGHGPSPSGPAPGRTRRPRDAGRRTRHDRSRDAAGAMIDATRPTPGVYWRFYWPLALTGAIGVVAVQFQNGALARYPQGVQELAIFALAQGVFALFRAGTDFIPQLVTRFARGDAARRVTLRYVIVLCAGCGVMIEFIGQSWLGATAIARIFGVEGYVLLRILAYLCLLAPLMLIEGVRMACVGMLVQLHMTGRVTLLNVVFLAVVAATLVAALLAGLPPTVALIGAQGAGSGVHAALGVVLVRAALRAQERAAAARRPQETEDVPDFGRLTRFFVPVATTGLMFAVTRPLIYAFVARMPEGVVSIAALRIAFDFTFFFQQASNQFRHFFVAFGLDDLAGKRRFMAQVTAGITALMLLIAATPVGEVLLRSGLGVDGEVLARAQAVILVMCLLPMLIIVRNYYHGILMVTELTASMATGGILRVLLVGLLSAGLAAQGVLDHLYGAWIMLAGFAIETLTVYGRVRRARLTGEVKT